MSDHVEEIEVEADGVCVCVVVAEFVSDSEAEGVDETVSLSEFEVEADNDNVEEMLAVAVRGILIVVVRVDVSENDRVAEAVPERETVADSERVTLLLVDTIWLGVALSVRQLRPP